MATRLKKRNAYSPLPVIFRYEPDTPNRFVVETYDFGGAKHEGFVEYDKNGEIVDKNINDFLNYASYMVYQTPDKEALAKLGDVDEILTKLFDDYAKNAYLMLQRGLQKGSVADIPLFLNGAFVGGAISMDLFPIYKADDGRYYGKTADTNLTIPQDDILVESEIEGGIDTSPL